jgi:HD-GYP domain-containing protein (c-di-GMP phosphodiesterase class II)
MLKMANSKFSAKTPAEPDDWQHMSGQVLQDSVLSPLIADLWNRNIETREHGLRMANMAWQIGKRMELTPIQLQSLVLLAQVHDLGKTMISEKIIRKSDTLDEAEWDEMKMHPVYGYRIAQLTKGIHHLAEGILCHHERWDGRGYPNKLAETAIPIASRIIAVADAFDVMTHERSYQKAVSAADAMTEISSNAGKQFDPAVVKVFTDIMQD